MGKYRKDTVEAYAHGGFSDVWKCHVLLVDNTIQAVALKELRAVNIPASKSDPASVYKRMIKRLEREILVWSRLQHPHIVPLVGFRFEPTCLISPWYSNGNLKDWVRRHPQAEKRKLTRQVVDGLMYLHSMSPPIVHGDIKSDNILMSDEGDAVINDFGLSQIMEDASESMNSTSTATIGNARWLAPEILCEGMKRSTASDVYSFGCLLLEIETGAMPFRGLPDIQVVVAVLSCKLPVSERDGYPELRENDTIWNMMLDCWNYDHYARPTMKIIEARL
ncbi:hypothetical protein FRC03_001009 [Tulasnella sp. 419]|nr:hypothetical protein FRC03_001009 [Tulasnella sp. 419]